jgi:hypothetical protein
VPEGNEMPEGRPMRDPMVFSEALPQREIRRLYDGEFTSEDNTNRTDDAVMQGEVPSKSLFDKFAGELEIQEILNQSRIAELYRYHMNIKNRLKNTYDEMTSELLYISILKLVKNCHRPYHDCSPSYFRVAKVSNQDEVFEYDRIKSISRGIGTTKLDRIVDIDLANSQYLTAFLIGFDFYD